MTRGALIQGAGTIKPTVERRAETMHFIQDATPGSSAAEGDPAPDQGSRIDEGESALVFTRVGRLVLYLKEHPAGET